MTINHFIIRKIVFLSIVIVNVLFVNTTAVYGQCSSDEFMDKCASTLGGFTFIKSFEVLSSKNVKESPNDFSYVLSKGSTYMIIICDQNVAGNKMVVELYDRNKKLIASNFNKQTKKFYPSLSYPCGATGVYYIESYFENGKQATCGVNILGFNK